MGFYQEEKRSRNKRKEKTMSQYESCLQGCGEEKRIRETKRNFLSVEVRTI